MSATLLADDRIKDRRNQFRREASRQEFLSPLAESRSQAPPGDARTRGSASAAPPVTAELPRAPDEAEPRVSGSPPALHAASPAPEPTPAPTLDGEPGTLDSAAPADAAELLADPSVRAALSGKVPSRRNREVFRAVVVAKRSQRDVAAEHDITQPRVCQIVQQVAAWLSQNVIEQDRPRGGLAQIQIAENLVRMQYDHLYATALDLLHGRGSEAPANADGQDAPPPHKPSAAFLNAALRVVNSRAKFEGVNGRAARRAMDEAQQRGISMFGPTNDNLLRDDGSTPEPAESSPCGPSYNPLSREPEDDSEQWETAADISEGFRDAYEPYREWFPGDFTARAAYYLTQHERAFDPLSPEDDREEEECERIELIHKWDLMAAEAQAEACRQAAGESPADWPPQRLAALRRRLLIEIMMRESSMLYQDDAEVLLECLEYDDASGRFGWDLRFAALREAAASHGEELGGSGVPTGTRRPAGIDMPPQNR